MVVAPLPERFEHLAQVSGSREAGLEQVEQLVVLEAMPVVEQLWMRNWVEVY